MSVTNDDKIGSLIIQELGLIRIALQGKMELAEEIVSLRERLSSPEEGSKEARKWLCNLADMPADTPWPELLKEFQRIQMVGGRRIKELRVRVAFLEKELGW